jgi:ADP-ribosylglycohydrolase
LISNKGDTDTNACIVGGVIGAIIGRNNMKMD